MKVSARKLMEYVLCPHSETLWEQDPMRIVFGRRMTAFKTAAKLCVNEGFEVGLSRLNQLVESANSRQLQALFRKPIEWYGDFYSHVARDGLKFESKGLRPKAKIGGHVVSLDVPLVQIAGNGQRVAWFLFDYVETGLGRDQYEIAVSATKWILATHDRSFIGVVFYVPRRGVIARVPITLVDAAWSPLPLLQWLETWAGDQIKAKNPGPHCTECWHFNRQRCDGPRTPSESPLVNRD